MTHNSRHVLVALLVPVAALALLSLSCGGSTPAGPPTTLPGTTTTTRPSPTPIPAAYCAFGQGTDEFDCERTHSLLADDVEGAMDMLIEQRPQIFDLNDEYAPGTRAYKVLDKNAYLNGLVANLQLMGLCAERDLDDPAQEMIFAKNSNDFDEEFDTLLGSGHMRRGTGIYRTTCTPAAFPVPRPADAPPIGSGCYRPWPPEIQRMNCKLHIQGADFYTLDSTPIVLDPLYCQHLGFVNPDCPVRPEGYSDRVACENWRVGTADDTHLPGPTWRKTDGATPAFCTGAESGCQHGSDSPYQLYVWASGTYTVKAQTGYACSVTVNR